MAQAIRVWFEADHVDYTPVSAVTGGDVVVIGSIPLVAEVDIAANTLGALATEGGFDVVKDTSTFSGGDAIYWNPTGSPVGGVASSGCASSSSSGAYLMGYCPPSGSALTGDATVLCVLTSSKRTATLAGSLGADDITGTDSTLSISGLAGSASAGGTVPIVGGAGNGSGNAGGATSMTGGAAGSGNAAGGATSIVGGVGAGTQAGGAAAVTGGASAASSSGNGGAASVTGGALGTSGTGVGGAATVTGGAGRAGGTAGSVTVDAGAANSGTAGTVSVGATNASSVTLGATSVPTVQPGPNTRGIGGSTAAAGSTNSDATGLPAGTASVYPTTAADDTKGVIIDVADKITGRMLFIGNGVSNKILKVYPPSGGTINGASANAAFSSASGKGVIIVCLSSGSNTWLAW